MRGIRVAFSLCTTYAPLKRGIDAPHHEKRIIPDEDRVKNKKFVTKEAVPLPFLPFLPLRLALAFSC
jgi:hypothetical protein